ncbi:HlyD family secretion protein [Halotalea alkalilenta]|uniref:HlyD family secretion protein n=1 Tax=Halotalea alkalilenta TaxID=376489 RepID=UPI0009DD05CF|nr:HlyD family secretion protein [Halotalea alkalilenta]
MHALTKKWLKRLILALLSMILLVAAIIWGLYWLQTGRFFQTTDNAYLRGDGVAIRSELSAKVVALGVAHNQRVSKGQLLVTLDDRDYRDQLRQAEAQLLEANAQVVQAERNVDASRAQIEQYQAQVAAAEARDDQALTTLNRTLMLSDRGVVPRQQLDDAHSERAVTRADLASSRAQLTTARRQLAVQQAALEAAKASVQSAEADVETARTQLGRTHIYAPADGVVGNVTIEVGSYAQPQLTLMQLVPVDALYVIANYKETQIGRMRIGQPVSISVDAYSDIGYEGVVESIAPATGAEFSLLPVDNATGNFNKIVQRVPVRIRLIGPQDQLGRLQAGLSVEPTVDTRRLEGNALYVVPAPNLMLDDERPVIPVHVPEPVDGR